MAGALLKPVQQRLLGLLFGQPERSFQSAEIIRLAGSGTGAVHRQLQRLAAAGLVAVSREGNQKYYQARKDSAIFPELHGLAIKTAGLLEPLRAALAPLDERIVAAFVFGSVAQGTDRAGSDVDLLVVSDSLEYPELYTALESAEQTLARPINPTLMNLSEWQRKRARPDSFAARIAGRPKLFVIGSEDVGCGLPHRCEAASAPAGAASRTLLLATSLPDRNSQMKVDGPPGRHQAGASRLP